MRRRLWSALALAPILPAASTGVSSAASASSAAAVHTATAAATHTVLTTTGRLLGLVARFPGPAVVAASLTGLTVGGLGGVAVHSEMTTRAARQASPPAHSLSSPSRSEALPAPVIPPPAATPETPPAAPAPIVESAARPTPGPAPVAAPAPRPVRTNAGLNTEAALIERARTALTRGWTDSALAAIEQHSARFPEGQLLEEREALRVLATARAGKVEEAQQLANAFATRFPDSLWLEQVAAAVPPQP